jgi:hypothetical protein
MALANNSMAINLFKRSLKAQMKMRRARMKLE